MKQQSGILGWVILDESGIPGAWFRTRKEARQLARQAGVPMWQVVRESE